MKIRHKILLLLLAISTLSVGSIGFVAYTLGKGALEQESFNKLTSIREIKASQIEDYFQIISDQIITLSKDRMLIEAAKAFDEGVFLLNDELKLADVDIERIDAKLNVYYQMVYLERLLPNLFEDADIDDYWPEATGRALQDLYISSNPFETGQKHLYNDAGDGSTYSAAHAVYHPILRDYLERFGYYDIFIVDVDSGGHIVYSVFKEVDFGTSLTEGPYRDTNFAQAYQKARDATDKDFIHLEDFEPYHPSYNAPASFISSPIFDGDQKVGVLIFQLPIDRINDIMTNNQQWAQVGLGESGETYIVGDDFLLRNQSRFLIEDSQNYFEMIKGIGLPGTTIAQIRNLNSSVGLQEVKTVGTEAALRGESGTAIFPDYRGVSVLSSYEPLNIPGVNWVIMSEIDEAEAFAYVQTLGARTLLVTLVIFAGTMVVSLIFSRTITNPLAALTNITQEVASGNLDVEIKYVGQKDEIGSLADSFSTMQSSITKLVGDLEDINQNLENLVEERTKELELSERRSRSIVDSAGEGIVVIDSDSKIILWNQAAEKMFGYLAADIVGSSMIKLVPERYLSQHNSASKKAMKSGQLAHPGVTHELAALRSDGSEFPLELTLSTWTIAGETYVSGILRDITERKAAEEAVRQSNERVRTIVKIAPDAVITIDSQQNITLFNPMAEEIFGYSAYDVIGQSLTMLMPEKSRGIHTSEVKKFSDESESARSMDNRREIFGRRKDGTTFPAEAGISKMEIDGEQYFTTFFRDITERKQMEAQLEIANERMSEELNFARDIQMGMLPLIFPAFPNRSEFNIFASLIPAREVGGDFYDFYFIDDYHICFVVGDVSGKGAPGALLMAVSKTLIKSRAMDDFSPSSILTHVNNELSQNNDAAMFVTVFLSIFDIRTGKMEYSNAGHNPPYIRRKDTTVEKMDEFHGPVIGALPGLHYKESSSALEQGDMIVLYSDGITEAMNLEDELYSDERLAKFLSNDTLNTPQKLVDQVVRDVKKHEGDAEQADDITILALEFTGQTEIEVTGRLDVKISNRISELAVVENQFEAFCQEYEIQDSVRQQVSMVLDEMLNNIVNYAFRDDDEHVINVEFVLSGSRLVITIRDDGVPFNPFALDPPNISLSLDEREVGGLGIYLVRSVMDEYMYTRHIGRNVVTLAKIINNK